MRIITLIVLVLLSSFKKTNGIRYDLIFSEDYANAKYFVSKHSSELKNASFIYKHGYFFSTAIVFPEIMRYSAIKDVIETTALELVYVNNGAEAADFSIGRFQMKPSFVESLEKEICTNDSLTEVYQEILLSINYTEKEKRQLRVERLKNTKWQLIYLHAFIAVCDERFKKSVYKNKNEKLILYATAYNSGFNQSAERLIKKSIKKCFPYGEKHEGTQYAYSDISNYYFTTNH